jgi:N-acetylneuraminic acid mutarotase
VGVSIYGLRMFGVSAITFSGTGVTGTIASSGDINQAFASVTIAAGAPLGVRDFTITNAFGTSAAFTGFTVANQTTMPVTWKSRSYLVDTRTGTGVFSPSADLIGTKIYTSHGSRTGTPNGSSALLSVFDIPTNTWTHGGTTAPDAVAARSALGGGVAFGKHYAVGGLTTSGATSAVEEFDPASNSWRGRTSMSVARASLGVASLNDRVYAIGGSTGGAPYSPGTILNANEVYDSLTNVWTTLAPLPVAVTGNTATIGYNGKIYVLGGLSASGVTGSVQIYDAATNTWSSGTPVPTPRFNAMAGVLNGLIVVFGGSAPTSFDSSGSLIYATLLDLTEIYDPVSNTWTIGPAMRFSSADAGQGVTFNGSQIVSVSGYASVGILSTVEVLDTSTDPQPTISSISQTSGTQGTTINATITGTNLTGATSIVFTSLFTGTGVSAAILPGGTATSLPVQITITNGATTGLRLFSVNTPTGTADLFTGFTVNLGP